MAGEADWLEWGEVGDWATVGLFEAWVLRLGGLDGIVGDPVVYVYVFVRCWESADRKTE